MRGFQENYQTIVRAAAGDQNAQEEALRIFLNGVRVWLRNAGELSLDRCMNLPPPSARSRLAKLKRDYWLTVAHGMCDGGSAWHRSTRLLAELTRFREVIWPAWKEQGGPPAGASELRSALYEVVIASPKKLPKSARAIHRIVTESHGEMSHRGGQNANVTTTNRSLPMSHNIRAIAEREWKASPSLRAEFCDKFETYLAYRTAEAEGRIKVLRSRKAGVSVNINVK